MATVLDLINNLKALDVKSIANTITSRYSNVIASNVRNQLWNGQKPDGSPITPSYLDDPHFKTRKQAEAYANWKYSGGYRANTTRNKYTPNLYINGYFYRGINATVAAGAFEVVASWNEVGSKYKDVLGLSEPHAEKMVEENIRPAWEVFVQAQTGLKFN